MKKQNNFDDFFVKKTDFLNDIKNYFKNFEDGILEDGILTLRHKINK